jgi:uncharacterized protein YgbK (DUF1537 family)
MTVTTRPAARFVPTLTEVVRPGVAAPTTGIDREALVEQVFQAVKPRLEQQLRTALYALVEEQLCKAAPQWQEDVETAVNAAVAQALAQRLPPRI